MTLSPEVRREINRENARKSTGPRTEAGKSRSRANALKHGLRAEVLPLPGEDPAVVAGRSDSWNDYYRPSSPAAKHLVNECVRATLLSDRCHRYHDTELARQIRGAIDQRDASQEDATARLIQLLETDPASAVRQLRRTSRGAAYLLERWEQLAAVLENEGYWPQAEIEEVLRLRGLRVLSGMLRLNPAAWVIQLSNRLCETGKVDDGRVAALFQADVLPDVWRFQYEHKGWLPCADAARAYLDEIVAREIGELGAEAVRLKSEIEVPDREQAAERALILHDEGQARRFLRYHSESRTAFQRAYGALLRTLDRDAKEAESGADDEAVLSPNKPISGKSEAEGPALPAGPPTGASETPPQPPEIDFALEDFPCPITLSPNKPISGKAEAEGPGLPAGPLTGASKTPSQPPDSAGQWMSVGPRAMPVTSGPCLSKASGSLHGGRIVRKRQAARSLGARPRARPP